MGSPAEPNRAAGSRRAPSVDCRVARAALVWLPLPVPPLAYLAPHDGPEGCVGARIAVPWQGGVRVGIVARIDELGAAKALELKEAVAVLDDGPWLLPSAVRLLEAQAARTATVPGIAVATMVPVGLLGELVHEVRPVAGVAPAALGPGSDALVAGAWTDVGEAGVAHADLETWRAHGLVDERVRPRPDLVRVLVPERPADAGLAGARRAAQRQALAELEAAGSAPSAAALARAVDVPESAVRALVTKGYAGYRDVEAADPPPPWVVDEGTGSSPGAPARAGSAADPDDVADDGVALVTGGRGADRLARLVAVVRRDVGAGRQVVVVAPELAAAATVAAALAEAEVPTLTLRGDQPPRVREAAWREAARGTPLALVGTYPVLCAPLPGLARVVVWDAASPSHKLIAGTRSVVRRDAAELAAAAGCPLLLLDPVATAELEAMGPGRRVRVPIARQRVVASDLRGSPTWPLGTDLIRTLRQVAERRRQAIVLVARRGYSAGLACAACGEGVMCPNCDLPLRLYERSSSLRCHQCGHRARPPGACPTCGGGPLASLPAAGTEWVAREVARVVPDLSVETLDADHRPDLAPFLAGESGVLVATSAALRLPPLPNLSLVALTLGDTLYSHEDFRAEEGALRTLLALADLAVERRPLVLVQTFRPEHRLWHVLTAEDPDAAVDAFLADIAERRARFGYPPSMVWARVQVTHRDEGAARRAALAVHAALRTGGVGEEALLGPAPAPVARLRGRFAQHLFVRTGDEASLAAVLAAVPSRPASGAQVRVDVDPYDVAAWLE